LSFLFEANKYDLDVESSPKRGCERQLLAWFDGTAVKRKKKDGSDDETYSEESDDDGSPLCSCLVLADAIVHRQDRTPALSSKKAATGAQGKKRKKVGRPRKVHDEHDDDDEESSDGNGETRCLTRSRGACEEAQEKALSKGRQRR
jgi:hypothetical protein